ncbi:MAG: hypothetical protein P8M16_05435 [Acidimicrobiales bacterium]|nr:hypothetical protein [Acidimicrobiales bacterium]
MVKFLSDTLDVGRGPLYASDAGDSGFDNLSGRFADMTNRVPEIVDLPSWVNPTFLRSASIIAIIIGVLLVIFAARIIRRLILRIAAVAILAVMVAGFWSQRIELADCAADCSCALFGQTVQVPPNMNPNC